MPKRLNIVYIADIPQTGGASASLFDLVTQLRQDYNVSCSVLFPSDGPLKRRLDDARVKTFVVGHRGFLVPCPTSGYKIVPKYAIEFARYHAERALAIRRAESFIDFSEVDLIHSNLPRTDLGLDLAKRHGIPHVCHLREFSFESFRCWSYRRHPVGYLNAGTDCFVAVSQACAKAWIQKGVDPDKVKVVYNGIGVEKFIGESTRRAARPKDSGKLRIVFLGGCDEAKGIWDAVEAMKLLPPSVADNVMLDIYGYGTAGVERKVKRYLSDNHLQERVALLGACDNVAELLPYYDCGLVCSRCEAFGRVVVEYQAAGLAVVGANTGSIPELLDGGRRGVLYNKAGGPIELAAMLSALALEREYVEQLKESGPAYAMKYGLEKTANAMAEQYEEILANRR